MDPQLQERVLNLILSIPAFVIAFVLHEFAHAYVADRLGDDTPRRMGRVTLDPAVHLDPMGSLLFVITSLFSPIAIGWPKPVLTMPRNFRNPNRDSALVAVAGPLANLLQVPFWCLGLVVMRFILPNAAASDSQNTITLATAMTTVLMQGVVVNMMLFALNLIPIPPLDGGYILEAVFPPLKPFFEAIRPVSFFLFFALVFAGVTNYIIMPFINWGFMLARLSLGMTI